jgi:RNA polymerase sporulation-specific sigma factor
MGLVKAADAFDDNRGLMFSTYAVPVIMGEVRRLFRDGGAVKVSRSVKELGLKINRERQLLEQTLCREPTINEIASRLEVTPEEVSEAVCATQNTVSLTYEGDDGIKETDLPTVSTEDELSNKLLLQEAFNKLDSKEKMIMNCRYYRYMTQSNTAKILNMTQVQVSRAEKKILLKLKDFLS